MIREKREVLEHEKSAAHEKFMRIRHNREATLKEEEREIRQKVASKQRGS